MWPYVQHASTCLGAVQFCDLWYNFYLITNKVVNLPFSCYQCALISHRPLWLSKGDFFFIRWACAGWLFIAISQYTQSGLRAENTLMGTLNANYWAYFSSSVFTSTLSLSTEEYKAEPRLTLLAGYLEHCEPRLLHLYPACKDSSWSPGSSEGSLCTPAPAPAIDLGDREGKEGRGKNNSLVVDNASDFWMNIWSKAWVGTVFLQKGH